MVQGDSRELLTFETVRELVARKAPQTRTVIEHTVKAAYEHIEER